MAVRFEDYYGVLGVPRTASQADIQSAYRKLARKHHPDVDKSAGATQRFQKITEAYEVLKDPAKRSRYDALGADWQNGQEFRPPPGWAPFEGRASSRRPRGAQQPEFEGFSDFFESLFGGGGGFTHEFGSEEMPRGRRAARHADDEGTVEIPLALAIDGGSREIGLRDASGAERHLEVKIPAGTAPGTTLRLRGQGAGGAADLLLHIDVVPPPGWRVDGDELVAPLRIAPWQAVLGARVPLVLANGGEAQVTVPPGSSSGRKLRLRGQGLPRKGEPRGDLIAEIEIAVPASPSDAERKLYESLRDLAGG